MLNYLQRWIDQLRWQRLQPFQKLTTPCYIIATVSTKSNSPPLQPYVDETIDNGTAAETTCSSYGCRNAGIFGSSSAR